MEDIGSDSDDERMLLHDLKKPGKKFVAASGGQKGQKVQERLDGSGKGHNTGKISETSLSSSDENSEYRYSAGPKTESKLSLRKKSRGSNKRESLVLPSKRAKGLKISKNLFSPSKVPKIIHGNGCLDQPSSSRSIDVSFGSRNSSLSPSESSQGKRLSLKSGNRATADVDKPKSTFERTTVKSRDQTPGKKDSPRGRVIPESDVSADETDPSSTRNFTDASVQKLHFTSEHKSSSGRGGKNSRKLGDEASKSSTGRKPSGEIKAGQRRVVLSSSEDSSDLEEGLESYFFQTRGQASSQDTVTHRVAAVGNSGKKLPPSQEETQPSTQEEVPRMFAERKVAKEEIPEKGSGKEPTAGCSNERSPSSPSRSSSSDSESILTQISMTNKVKRDGIGKEMGPKKSERPSQKQQNLFATLKAKGPWLSKKISEVRAKQLQASVSKQHSHSSLEDSPQEMQDVENPTTNAKNLLLALKSKKTNVNQMITKVKAKQSEEGRGLSEENINNETSSISSGRKHTPESRRQHHQNKESSTIVYVSSDEETQKTEDIQVRVKEDPDHDMSLSPQQWMKKPFSLNKSGDTTINYVGMGTGSNVSFSPERQVESRSGDSTLEYPLPSNREVCIDPEHSVSTSLVQPSERPLSINNSGDSTPEYPLTSCWESRDNMSGSSEGSSAIPNLRNFLASSARSNSDSSLSQEVPYQGGTIKRNVHLELGDSDRTVSHLKKDISSSSTATLNSMPSLDKKPSEVIENDVAEEPCSPPLLTQYPLSDFSADSCLSHSTPLSSQKNLQKMSSTVNNLRNSERSLTLKKVSGRADPKSDSPMFSQSTSVEWEQNRGDVQGKINEALDMLDEIDQTIEMLDAIVPPGKSTMDAHDDTDFDDVDKNSEEDLFTQEPEAGGSSMHYDEEGPSKLGLCVRISAAGGISVENSNQAVIKKESDSNDGAGEVCQYTSYSEINDVVHIFDSEDEELFQSQFILTSSPSREEMSEESSRVSGERRAEGDDDDDQPNSHAAIKGCSLNYNDEGSPDVEYRSPKQESSRKTTDTDDTETFIQMDSDDDSYLLEAVLSTESPVGKLLKSFNKAQQSKNVEMNDNDCNHDLKRNGDADGIHDNVYDQSTQIASPSRKVDDNDIFLAHTQLDYDQDSKLSPPSSGNDLSESMDHQEEEDMDDIYLAHTQVDYVMHSSDDEGEKADESSGVEDGVSVKEKRTSPQARCGPHEEGDFTAGRVSDNDNDLYCAETQRYSPSPPVEAESWDLHSTPRDSSLAHAGGEDLYSAETQDPYSMETSEDSSLSQTYSHDVYSLETVVDSPVPPDEVESPYSVETIVDSPSEVGSQDPYTMETLEDSISLKSGNTETDIVRGTSGKDHKPMTTVQSGDSILGSDEVRRKSKVAESSGRANLFEAMASETFTRSSLTQVPNKGIEVLSPRAEPAAGTSKASSVQEEIPVSLSAENIPKDNYSEKFKIESSVPKRKASANLKNFPTKIPKLQSFEEKAVPVPADEESNRERSLVVSAVDGESDVYSAQTLVDEEVISLGSSDDNDLPPDFFTMQTVADEMKVSPDSSDYDDADTSLGQLTENKSGVKDSKGNEDYANVADTRTSRISAGEHTTNDMSYSHDHQTVNNASGISSASYQLAKTTKLQSFKEEAATLPPGENTNGDGSSVVPAGDDRNDVYNMQTLPDDEVVSVGSTDGDELTSDFFTVQTLADEMKVSSDNSDNDDAATPSRGENSNGDGLSVVPAGDDRNDVYNMQTLPDEEVVSMGSTDGDELSSDFFTGQTLADEMKASSDSSDNDAAAAASLAQRLTENKSGIKDASGLDTRDREGIMRVADTKISKVSTGDLAANDLSIPPDHQTVNNASGIPSALDIEIMRKMTGNQPILPKDYRIRAKYLDVISHIGGDQVVQTLHQRESGQIDNSGNNNERNASSALVSVSPGTETIRNQSDLDTMTSDLQQKPSLPQTAPFDLKSRKETEVPQKPKRVILTAICRPQNSCSSSANKRFADQDNNLRMKRPCKESRDEEHGITTSKQKHPVKQQGNLSSSTVPSGTKDSSSKFKPSPSVWLTANKGKTTVTRQPKAKSVGKLLSKAKSRKPRNSSATERDRLNMQLRTAMQQMKKREIGSAPAQGWKASSSHSVSGQQNDENEDVEVPCTQEVMEKGLPIDKPKLVKKKPVGLEKLRCGRESIEKEKERKGQEANSLPGSSSDKLRDGSGVKGIPCDKDSTKDFQSKSSSLGERPPVPLFTGGKTSAVVPASDQPVVAQNKTATAPNGEITPKNTGASTTGEDLASVFETLQNVSKCNESNPAMSNHPSTMPTSQVITTTASSISFVNPASVAVTPTQPVKPSAHSGHVDGIITSQLDTVKSSSSVGGAHAESTSSKPTSSFSKGILKEPNRQVPRPSNSGARLGVSFNESGNKMQIIESVQPVPGLVFPERRRLKETPKPKPEAKLKFLSTVLNWRSEWFEEQDDKSIPPLFGREISAKDCSPLLMFYSAFDEYVEITTKLLILEFWEMILREWKIKKSTQRCELDVMLERKPDHDELSKQHGLVNMDVVGFVAPSERQNIPSLEDILIVHVWGQSKLDPSTKEPKWFQQFAYVKNVEVINKVDKSQFAHKYKLFGSSSVLRNQNPVEFRLRLGMRYKGVPFPVKLFRIQVISSFTTTLRQVEALVQLPVNPLCESLLVPSPSDVFFHRRVEPDPRLIAAKLNKEQAAAVSIIQEGILRGGQGQKVFVLQGPPGTGKSHTILVLIHQILIRTHFKARICLATPSNAAVDEIAKRIIQFSKKLKDQRLPGISLVRVGSTKSIHPDVREYKWEHLVDKQCLSEAAQGVSESVKVEIKSHKVVVEELMRSLSDKGMAREQRVVKTQKLQEAEKAIRRLEGQMTSRQPTRRERYNAECHVLDNAQVICGTLSSFGSSRLKEILLRRNKLYGDAGKPFTCLIIDEATQAIEVDCLIPLQYKVSKIVLVGDIEQLPATVLSQRAIDKCLNQSLFERLGKNFKVFHQENPLWTSPVMMLTTQYRMHEEILSLPNSFFYDRQLVTDRSVQTREQVLAPYLVFNIQESRETRDGSNRSLSNEDEASCTAQLCLLVMHALREKPDSVKKRIGVICPYTDQRQTIIKHLRKIDLSNIEVTTVDGFQGQERDVIIMSCVRAQTNPSSIGFVADRKRMNVALTRARLALYVMGHFDTLRTDVLWGELYRNAMDRKLLIHVAKTAEFSYIAEKNIRSKRHKDGGEKRQDSR